MFKRIRDLALRLSPIAALATGCGSTVQQATTAAPTASVLTHEVTRIDGTAGDLAAYRGKVLLIVNTASRCGFTPQYESLESLYREKQEAGFVILGFPSNDFLGQEPGTNAEIAEFCSTTYDVTFPMFEKIKVKGSDAHPLFRDLAAAAGEPGWNFNKYLIDRNGRVVARYGSRVRPDDSDLLAQIEALLANKPD